MFFEKIISLLNRVHRKDPFVEAVSRAYSKTLVRLWAFLDIIKGNFFFDTLNRDGVLWWESLLKITPTSSQTLDDRRAAINAKWLSKCHNSIELVQRVCNAWKNGEVAADFIDGKIQITFVGGYGIPKDLDGLVHAVSEIKPAHIGIKCLFKYLLKKEIHHVLTKNEMQALKKGVYCDVKAEGE